MRYVAGVEGDAPIQERVVVTEDYSEYCRKTSELAKRFLSPARAKAITYLLRDFEHGNRAFIDNFYLEGKE